MYVKSMRSPSKATGLWEEKVKDTAHRIRMAVMGLVIGVFGMAVFFATIMMADSRIRIWMMVVAHGWTEPRARGVNTIRVQIM